MASIQKLKPGQTVWSVERVKTGIRGVTREAVYPVYVIEVNENFVIASWNGNARKRFSGRAVGKWRVKKPEKKG